MQDEKTGSAVVSAADGRAGAGWTHLESLTWEIGLIPESVRNRVRQAEAVIHHSDQRCQYTSLAFSRRCEEAGVRPSMGSVGDCFDNAMAERFFATLE